MQLIDKPILPLKPRPIAIIGAGGVVNDAHLPAYALAGFEVWGIADAAPDRAIATAKKYAIAHAMPTVDALIAAAPAGCVFDIALPASANADVLRKLPEGSGVLIQKPMGDTLAQAEEIVAICRQRRLLAAVNFQLRYAPFVLAARDMIARGMIGEIYDMEVRVCVRMPWDLFPSVKMNPRLEICYHSIHYIDLIRSFLGNPAGIYARTVRHPAKPLSSTRTCIILNYGNNVRANINTNHDHDFGPHAQDSFIKWEGTAGAIRAKMGLLMNYPHGVPDCFEYCLLPQTGEPKWQEQKLHGSWFPHGFIGTMASLMRRVEGTENDIPTSVEDALFTMRCVEAAYQSSDGGGTAIV